MFNSNLLYEKRPLKKQRIGPPDVYPQEPKQKEDELTSVNVKHGFPTMTHLNDEFGTARNCNVTASKVGAYFNSIINRKEELNMLPDSGRKRQQINPKDNFLPVTIRTKNYIEAWFKNLAGSKPLMDLARKAPNFNKKEEIFMMLTEYQVPMMRAAWFIKLSSAYTVAVSEAKIKKRQMSDPTTEWTQTLLKFLKDQIPRLQEYYAQNEKPPPPNTALATLANNETEQKLALRHWIYCSRLIKYMYEEGLIDRQEVLTWINDLLEKYEKQKTQSQDDSLLRLILPMALQYLDEFVQSELLSRKLCHFATKKLNFMLCNVAETNVMTSPQSETKTEPKESEKEKKENTPLTNSVQSTLQEYQNCQHHKDIVLQLSTIIHTIILECPTSLVWCSTGIGTQWYGSPLDSLPLIPSNLPMPARCDMNTYRKQIQHAENCIRERSKRAEGKWCTDKWQTSSAGTVTTKVLSALDALDRHRFDRMDSTNSLDTLYSKVFSGPVDQESAVVKLLCEWAVSPERTGEHRALAVAALLDKRQSDSNPSGDQEANPGDDKDSNSSVPGGPPMFQSLLMKFLDNDAPVPQPDDCQQKKTAFSNLVHLFSELIRRDVFSHDAYMCTLISRGDLLGHEDNTDATSMTNTHSKMEPMDYDDADVDNDLDKILQNIKEDQQNSMELPDSPKDHDHSHHPHVPQMGHVPMEGHHGDHKVKPSRHFLYTTHFPLSQDDPFSQHDCNQRHVLLYGVGKVRDEARHTVKKMSKEICKLFSKKFSVDVAEGGKVKKHSRNEFNFEATTQKCQSLSYFDQHVVTWQCSVTVIEMLNSFATGNFNYLPVQEHVAFLFDLMELALNIYGLIDVCIQILKELPEVENQLYNKNSVLSRNYTTGLSLYIVGVLRRYHCCLLLSPEQTSAVFEGLCKVVKHVTNPGDCSSAERCILAHLYDLYSSCSLLKSKPHTVEPFGNAYPKIKQALYSTLQPAPASYVYNQQFMQEILINPRRMGRVDQAWAKQLNESGNNRYSFVTNAVIRVCRETDNERLNDLAIMCAEMTACCNTLASEWLGVLLVLCSPMSHPGYYGEVLSQLDIQDVSIHNALAVFTCILIARHCFSLEDFVGRVALPSLLKVKSLDSGGGIAEGGMRLTCHLLLRLFRTAEGPQPGLYSVGSPPLTSPRLPLGIRLSCDRHLLAAAHRNIDVGPVLAVLKAVLIVGDATAKEGTELSLSNILGTSDLHTGPDGPNLDLPQISTSNPEGTASLSAFANHVLREICSQQWVLDRCLCHPEKLCDSDNLLDDLLTHSQAQRLLHMICYPDAASSIDELDQKSMISRILENLELWTLRMSWLDLQLMFKQYSVNTPELSQWLDTVAKAAIDVFQLNSNGGNLPKPEDTKKPPTDSKSKTSSIWLVAPLVAKLPSAVQGRILKVAGQVLESGGWCKELKPKMKSSGDSQSLLTHQPFLSLVLTCLKGQEEGLREGLLSSLHQQLTQLVQQAKEGNIQEICHSERTLDGLQLRFALVGGVFEAFQRSTSATIDWALLLVQLVTNGIIDLHTNSELFTTVIDMLATLVHSALAVDSQDEGRKMYQNLMKKIKKEVGERQNASLQHIKQLLPLTRVITEIIAVEPAGSITDHKGNKISFDNNMDKKHDLQVTDKQRVSSWDILEGMKNPPPLSWSWFGAVRLERKPLANEDTHRLLKFHTHNLQKPSSHYLEPPPLPPEDLEPIPDKPVNTPSSVEQSPAGGLGKGRGKGQRKRKAKPGGPMHASPIQTMGQSPMGQGQPGMGMGMPGQNPQMGHNMAGYGQNPVMQQGQQYGGNPGGQWYGQNQNPQQGYGGYPGMPANRFERPQMNNSKQALSNMLRQRHPYMPGMQNNQVATPQNPGYGQMQRGFPRQGLRQQHPGTMQSNQQGMFPNQYGNMQGGMSNQYGNFGGNSGMMQGNMQNNPQMQMQGAQGNMFAGQQGFGQPRPNQPNFGQMGQQNPRAPYMQQTPNVTMNTNMGGMGGMGAQGGPAPPYSRPAQMMQQQGGMNQNPTFQQQRMRQQMMAMQQQQGGNQGNQPSPALMAQLQRQQQMNPNAYHQPPPYNMQ